MSWTLSAMMIEKMGDDMPASKLSSCGGPGASVSLRHPAEPGHRLGGDCHLDPRSVVWHREYRLGHCSPRGQDPGGRGERAALAWLHTTQLTEDLPSLSRCWGFPDFSGTRGAVI
jgi:hypothetical protein